MTADRRGVSFWGDGNILKLDDGDDCATSWIQMLLDLRGGYIPAS